MATLLTSEEKTQSFDDEFSLIGEVARIQKLRVQDGTHRLVEQENGATAEIGRAVLKFRSNLGIMKVDFARAYRLDPVWLAFLEDENLLMSELQETLGYITYILGNPVDQLPL